LTRRVIADVTRLAHDGGMETTDLTTMIDDHLAGYCEPDPARRTELLAGAWAQGGVLLDPPMEATGVDGIAGLVDVVLEHYPAHTFRRTSAVDTHHDHARYTWELVAPDGTVAVAGLDVARVEDGRLASVVGFFGDLEPAAV
jgi:hypothetical protein